MKDRHRDKKKTLMDVANYAGVSIASVSRVLNNIPPISDELRNQVERMVIMCPGRVIQLEDLAAEIRAGIPSAAMSRRGERVLPAPDPEMARTGGGGDAVERRGFELVFECLDGVEVRLHGVAPMGG